MFICDRLHPILYMVMLTRSFVSGSEEEEELFMELDSYLHNHYCFIRSRNVPFNSVPLLSVRTHNNPTRGRCLRPTGTLSRYYCPQRKLRKGTVFTHVCLSTIRGVEGVPQHEPGQEVVWSGGVCGRGMCGQRECTATEAGGTHPTGMLSRFSFCR